MKVDILHDEELAKEFHVQISKEEFEKKYDDILKTESIHLTITGFRKGKAPLALVKKNYGERLDHRARTDILNESVDEIAAKYKLNKDKLKFKLNHNHSNSIDFNLFYDTVEQFTLKDLSDFQLDKYVLDSESDELKKLSFEKRFLQASIDFKNEIETEIKDGHYVQANFSVFHNDTLKMESYNKRNLFFLANGEKSLKFLGKDFMKAIIGMKTGEIKRFDMTFPKEQPSKLANTKHSVEIEIIKVFNVLPMTDKEFFEKLKETYRVESLDQLKSEIFADFVLDFDNRYTQFVHKRRALDAIDEAYSFKFSQKRLDESIANIKKRYETEKERANKDSEILEEEMSKTPEELEKEFKKIAFRTLKISEVFDKLHEKYKHELQITEMDITMSLYRYCMNNNVEVHLVQQLFGKNETFRNHILSTLSEEKIIKLILDHAKTTEKKITHIEDILKIYDEIMPGVLVGI